MAQKATIFKADLTVADMDRHHYQDYALVVARHPSETDERMMVRLLAFALNAGDALTFGKGLATDDEPDLWHRDLTGAIETWIDVGRPDERRIRKACGRAARVIVYAYGTGADIWWGQVADKLSRAGNLTVITLPPVATQALAKLARRTMRLQCMIQDGEVWMSDDDARVEVPMVTTLAPPASR